LVENRVALAWGHVIVVTAGLMPLGFLWPHPGTWAAAVICMGFVATMNGVSSLMRGTGLFAQEALWQMAGRTVSALFIGAVLAWGWSHELALIFGAWSLGLAVVLGWGGRHWLTRPRWPWTQGLSHMQGNYRQVAPFVLIAATGAWLIKGDMVLLGSGWGFAPSAQATSMYAACTRLTEASLLVFAPFANVLFRRLNQLHANKEQAAMKTLGWRSVALALGLGSTAVGLTVWLGDALMPLLFGAPFTTAGALLPWVSCMLPLAMANLVLLQWLTALGRERFLSRLMLLSAALLSLLLPWMTSRWGMQGTALSVVAAHALVLLISLTQVTR
jgi:O-antigen/teichoic acid export membrane protein